MLIHLVSALCPARCCCNDEALRAACVGAGLEIVPIQLNPEVKHIDLSNNKINTVHFTLRFYNNLISLDISHNKVQKLGSSNFASQHNMKHLNLSHNEIVNLTRDSFKGLHSLTVLDLSFNRLDKLYNYAFKELQSLEILVLTGNQIEYIDEGMLNTAKQLKELFLNDNQLLEVPVSAILECTNLQIISLSHNLLQSVDADGFPNLPQLKTLKLDNNVIDEIHPSAFSGLQFLESLDLSDNNFTSIPTASLAKLSHLRLLRLSGNFFVDIPPVAFRSLFELKYLRLDRLELLNKVHSRAFVDNIDLEKVWLDDNIGLSVIPTRLFHGNPRLIQISIRNCQLYSLEVPHFPLDQLKLLELGGNPLFCNCSLLWLWKLIQEQHVKPTTNGSEPYKLVIDSENIRCAEPEELTDVLLRDTFESQIGCSMGWIAAVSIAASMMLIVGTICVFLFCTPMKKRSPKKNLPTIEGTLPDVADENHYEDLMVDKYIMGSSLAHEYKTLAPWQPYFTDGSDLNEQHDQNVKTRPHIVYV